MRRAAALILTCIWATVFAISGVMAFELVSPYSNDAGYVLLRGQLHCHTESVFFDRTIDVKTLAQKYKDRGFYFVALTDHNKCTVGSDDDWSGLVPVNNSEEITYKISNLLALGMTCTDPIKLVGKDDPEASRDTIAGQLSGMISAVHERGGLVVVAHPDGVDRGEHMFEWEITPGTRRDAVGLLLQQWKNGNTDASDYDFSKKKAPDAIAIYNAAWVVRGSGSTFMHYWDEMLGKGYRIWGIAEDDFHAQSRKFGVGILSFTAGSAWVAVPAEPEIPWSDGQETWNPATDTLTGNTLKANIYNGNFYCYWVTTPTKPDNYWSKDLGDPPSIKVSIEPGNRIVVSVRSRDAQLCKVESVEFRGRNGAVLRLVKNTADAVYDCKGSEGYVRVEIYKPLSGFRELHIASQPIFIRQ
ncbi:MAG: hypothetical protein ABFD49_10420 [Armatimonadota bacterium]|nr:hypothetical protein [bacterium]